MSHANDMRHGRHCVFTMHVHLVFVAKYRRRVLDGEAITRLRSIFTNVCTNLEAQLIEMDGEADHMHLLVEYPPKIASQGRIQPPAARGTARHCQALLAGGTVVAVLLRFKLRWCANLHRAAVH
jgi:REP element-mobilizing transposase RayT